MIQITFNIYEGILHNESAKFLNLSTVIIEKDLQDVEKFSAGIIATGEIQEQLFKLKNRTLSLYEKSQIEDNLTASLWSFVFEKNIASVNLIDVHGAQYSGGAPIPAAIMKPVITKAAQKKGALLLMEPIPKESSLICARQIRAISNLSLEPLGTLIIRVNIEQLVRRYTTGFGNYGDNLVIFSGKKVVYASNDLSKTAVPLLGFDNEKGYQVRKIKGKNYFIVYTKSTFSGWVYANVLPYEVIFKKIILMRNFVLIFFGLIFLFTIWISIKLARSLTRPIEILTAKIKRVENGAFEFDGASAFENTSETAPAAIRADEIGDLQRDFDIMIQKINVLIKENYTKQLIIKDTQFKALQAQINPHFLYNTLESINWLAKMNHQQEISQIVESLGKLLRNAISNKAQLITLKEEIELLLNYITIQRIRFGERLDFRLEIEDKWQGIFIPKLSLQPLVENSINYGLEQIPGVCRITVKSIDMGDDLCLVIEDNGPGLDPLILDKLDCGNIQPKGLGIGLKNINDRLKLIFGESFGINISGTTGSGARIMVRIPKTEEQDEYVQSFTRG
ncbi:MAG: sensor histidine kinase [Firmicutes bacterium]|nr:sensor histidine kinase [Bacillota bacterium]